MQWGRTIVVAVALVAATTSAAVADSEIPPIPFFTEPHDPIPAMTTAAGEVRDILRVGDRIFVAGSFTTLRPFVGGNLIGQSYLAALDADTGAIIQSFDPVLDDEVRALGVSPDGSRLYIGGRFRTINGQPQDYLAALDPSTGDVIPWAEASFGATNAIVVDDSGAVYVGGFFGKINGVTRSRVAKVHGTTGQVLPWYPVTLESEDPLRSLAFSPSGDRIYIAGGYTEQLGLPPDEWVFRGYIEAFSTTTGAKMTSFAAAPEYDVLDVTAHGSRVYAAMGGPGGRGNVYRASNGSEEASYFADGDVQTVQVVGNKAYFGGHFFEEFGGLPALYVATVDVTDLSADTSFSPELSGSAGLWTIYFDGDHLWLAGDINDAEPTSLAGFARFSQPPAESNPPSRITGLSVTASSPTSFSFRWNASSDDSPFSYIVKRDGNRVAQLWGATSYTDTGLTPETAYRYKIFAKDIWGNTSPKQTLNLVTPGLPTTRLIGSSETWRYKDDGSNQGTAWRAVAFGDSGWATGSAELGYGDGDEATVINSGPAGNRHITSYFRHGFEVDGRSVVTALELDVLADDGAVAYLNGTEIARINMPGGPIGYQTRAASGVAGSGETTFTTVAVDPSLLRSGTNVLAVEVHQVDPTSSDVSFNARLRAAIVEPRTLITKGARWDYDDDGKKDPKWRTRTFNSAGWATGPAQLGYGDGDEATVTKSGFVTTYFRKEFELTKVERFQIQKLVLKLLRDDGAVVYVNGKEVLRSNMPNGAITPKTKATKAVKGAGERKWRRFTIPTSYLRTGVNVVAVELHQVKKTSNDASFGLKLTGTP